MTEKLNNYETLNQVKYINNILHVVYIQILMTQELSNKLKNTEKVKKGMSMELDKLHQINRHCTNM